jgi:6-phosphogluconolactonase
MRVEVLPDATAVARRGAAIVTDRARAAVAERGRFAVALSGGRTPWAMVAALAGEDVPWEHVSVFQVDERVAPDGDPDRNLTQLLAALPPAAAPAEIVPMTVTGDMDEAATAYAALLPRRLDLVHLGLGPDGHTASLVPGDLVLDVTDREVAPTGVYEGRRRLTLTYPALDRAREVLWLVTGADKRSALRRLRAGDAAIPAGRVQTAVQLLLADAAAAGELQGVAVSPRES